MSCPNCNCPRCCNERQQTQSERYAAFNRLPNCPKCEGTGKVEDVCGHHAALITCDRCRGVGK